MMATTEKAFPVLIEGQYPVHSPRGFGYACHPPPYAATLLTNLKH
jgi:hypothetical protein